MDTFSDPPSASVVTKVAVRTVDLNSPRLTWCSVVDPTARTSQKEVRLRVQIGRSLADLQQNPSHPTQNLGEVAKWHIDNPEQIFTRPVSLNTVNEKIAFTPPLLKKGVCVSLKVQNIRNEFPFDIAVTGLEGFATLNQCVLSSNHGQRVMFVANANQNDSHPSYEIARLNEVFFSPNYKKYGHLNEATLGEGVIEVGNQATGEAYPHIPKDHVFMNIVNRNADSFPTTSDANSKQDPDAVKAVMNGQSFLRVTTHFLSTLQRTLTEEILKKFPFVDFARADLRFTNLDRHSQTPQIPFRELYFSGFPEDSVDVEMRKTRKLSFELVLVYAFGELEFSARMDCENAALGA